MPQHVRIDSMLLQVVSLLPCDELQVRCEVKTHYKQQLGDKHSNSMKAKEGIGMRAACSRDYFEEQRLDNIYLSTHCTI